MAKNNRGGNRTERSAFSFETAKESPLATAAVVGAAAAAGAFLWSRRNQISDQLGNLSDQISEWREGMGSSGSQSDFEMAGAGDDMMSSSSGMSGSRSSSSGTSRRKGGMSATGGGNSGLGARSGGGGMTSSASGRGRAQSNPTS